jgi:hypothetical protein
MKRRGGRCNSGRQTNFSEAAQIKAQFLFFEAMMEGSP